MIELSKDCTCHVIFHDDPPVDGIISGNSVCNSGSMYGVEIQYRYATFILPQICVPLVLNVFEFRTFFKNQDDYIYKIHSSTITIYHLMENPPINNEVEQTSQGPGS